MNFICETVTIVESNIMFDANFLSALPLPRVWHGQKSMAMPFSIHSKSKPPKFTLTAKYVKKNSDYYDSHSFIHHLCFGVSLVFPKILTSLNVNHPIDIHVTNARGFPCMCGLRLHLGSDLSLARKKYFGTILFYIELA